MNVDALREALADAGLGSVLGEEEVAALARAAVVRRFERGELLWRAGGASRGLFLLLDGEIRILRARDGRQHLVHVSRSGATMGEVPLFAGTGYPATAVASRDGSAIVIPPAEMLSLARGNARLATLLLRVVCRRLSALIDRLEANTLGAVRGRLASSLLAMAADLPPGASLTFPGGQSEWAENLGTVRETLSRELRALIGAGHLERRGRGAYAILDEAALERIALGQDA